MIKNVMSRAGRSWRLSTSLLATLAGALALAAPAAAASTSTITSSNWSGYAAHGSSAKFTNVTARWRVPAATCVTGEQSFSSFWIGIGGYNENSDGLEQDGTELDCTAHGTQTVSAWYELLPAAPHTVSMTVKSGDLISAAVHVHGKRVTLRITDLTRQESFAKTVSDADVDNTSAEWIAEAPSDCTTDSDCTVLPLADFGAVRFANATATTTQGVTSGISTSRWTTTKLLLGYTTENSSFIAASTGESASPSALTDSSREFEVTWSGTLASATSTGSSSGATGTSSGSGTTGTSSGSGSANPPNPGGGGGFGNGGDPGSGAQGGGPGQGGGSGGNF